MTFYRVPSHSAAIRRSIPVTVVAVAAAAAPYVATLEWQQPLSVAPPVAQAQTRGFSFVPFDTAQRSVNFTNFGWHPPTSAAAPVAKAQAGFSFVPFDTRQLSVNFTNFGWHGTTATAPPVARAQPGNSFVPFDTRQLSVNFTSYGWHRPLSPAPPVAQAQAGTSFVPYNTAQLALNYTNFGWYQTLSTPAPVAKARQGFAFVPFDTAQNLVIGIPLTMGDAAPSAWTVYYQSRFEAPYFPPAVVAAAYTDFYFQPLSIAQPVARAAPGFWFVPFDTVQVTPPSELGGTTSRGGGGTRAIGGHCRKTWKKCLEEIRQQLADEQASLKAAKARHDEIDYAARMARIAAIHERAAALEAECAAESLAAASVRIERFIDKITKIEAAYQAALFEEDEDDVLTMLLT